MRKVCEKSIRLFLERKNGKTSRSDHIVTVTCSDGSKITLWRYHLNCIACLNDEGIFINWQGYSHAQSTRERIYAICNYVNADRPEKKEGWIKIA